MATVPASGYLYSRLTAVLVDASEPDEVVITVEKVIDRTPVRKTVTTDWESNTPDPDSRGGRFDSEKVWIGGTGTLKRVTGSPSSGYETVLVNNDYIENNFGEEWEKWIDGIKWPASGGE